jgi:hypothetical protein
VPDKKRGKVPHGLRDNFHHSMEAIFFKAKFSGLSAALLRDCRAAGLRKDAVKT